MRQAFRAPSSTGVCRISNAPTTAAPSIGEFTTRYQRLFNQGCDHVISIHAARPLSAMLGTAEQAAGEFDGRVSVVDSRSLSLGLGFQAWRRPRRLATD